MKVKKVNRYWCDHCGKAGLSAPHMLKHERKCTKNPNRVCGVCKIIGQQQPDIEALKKIVRDSGIREGGCDEEGMSTDYVPEALLPALDLGSGGCPACMLAAIRQCGFSAPMVKDFDFKKRMQEVWDEYGSIETTDY